MDGWMEVLSGHCVLHWWFLNACLMWSLFVQSISLDCVCFLSITFLKTWFPYKLKHNWKWRVVKMTRSPISYFTANESANWTVEDFFFLSLILTSCLETVKLWPQGRTCVSWVTPWTFLPWTLETLDLLKTRFLFRTAQTVISCLTSGDMEA